MGPKTMNAIRAKIGKLTNVAAIKASEVLQSVSTRAMAIIEIVESVGSSARGRDYLLVNRGVESRGNRRADHEINRSINGVVAGHSEPQQSTFAGMWLRIHSLRHQGAD